MDVDPLASMRCWAIDVELGGRVYEIPALPAADWWPVLISRDVTSVLDLLRSSPEDDLDEMILSGDLTGEEMTVALTDALEQATGRSAHASVVLAAVAAMSWPMVNGEMVRHGFRWDVMPIGAALDVIYSLIVATLAEKSEDGKRRPREDFLRLLDGPPGKPNREQMAADFETVAGPRPTTGVVATGERSGSARPKTRRRPRPPRQGVPSPEPTPPPGQLG